MTNIEFDSAVSELKSKTSYSFSDLCLIVEVLRHERGCPWDREQTHKSIRKNMLEEAYEAAEAIDLEDKELLCEELGDVMLQTVLHASISASDGGFDVNDVCTGICSKLIVRHPHVFGDVTVSGTNEVLKNWENIKQATKGVKTAFEAQILEEGTILLDAIKLSSMIRTLPDGEITISSDANFVTTISAGAAKFEILGMSGDLFPSMPMLAGDKKFVIQQGQLKKMLQHKAI